MKAISRVLVIGLVLLLVMSCSVTPPPIETPEATSPQTEESTEQAPPPTKTPKPRGTFVGCLYFQGEAVPGYLTFFNDLGPYSGVGEDGRVEVTGECASVSLAPGTYEVSGRYLGDTRCGDDKGGGCVTDRVVIEITAGETLQMDLELKATQG